MDVISPRCVGPALNPSAIYITTHFDHTVELICLQGNGQQQGDVVDGIEPLKTCVRRNMSTMDRYV